MYTALCADIMPSMIALNSGPVSLSPGREYDLLIGLFSSVPQYGLEGVVGDLLRPIRVSARDVQEEIDGPGCALEAQFPQPRKQVILALRRPLLAPRPQLTGIDQ